MSSTIEKRKAVLVNTAYFALILVGFYLFLKYAFWLFAPFIFAFVVASLLQKPRNAIVDHSFINKGLASVLLVLVSLSAIITIFALVGIRLAAEVEGILDIVMRYIKNIPDYIKQTETTLLGIADRLPDTIGEETKEAIENFANNLINSSGEGTITEPSGFNIFKFLKTPLNGVWNTAKQIPSIFVGFLVFIIASCFMTADYDRIVGFIKHQFSPEKRRKLEKTKKIAFSSIGKLIKSYIIIMCITFAEMSVGLYTLKVIGVFSGKYIFAVALATALVDIFPILGTGTVLIPWSVILFITGNYGMGVGILVIYGCITVIRQIIEPKIVANNLGIPPILSLMGMFIGLKLFGVVGLFLMPITITVLKVLNDEGVIRLWNRYRESDDKNKKKKKKPKDRNDGTKESAKNDDADLIPKDDAEEESENPTGDDEKVLAEEKEN